MLTLNEVWSVCCRLTAKCASARIMNNNLYLMQLWPVAYLGGHGAIPPSFGPTMKFFYRRLYIKRCVFCRFLANFRKMGEFAASIERSKAKSVSASGGLRPPDHPTRGSASGPRWGLRPQTPVIGSRSARSPCPLCQILNTPLDIDMVTVYTARNWRWEEQTEARNT